MLTYQSALALLHCQPHGQTHVHTHAQTCIYSRMYVCVCICTQNNVDFCAQVTYFSMRDMNHKDVKHIDSYVHSPSLPYWIKNRCLHSLHSSQTQKWFDLSGFECVLSPIKPGSRCNSVFINTSALGFVWHGPCATDYHSHSPTIETIFSPFFLALILKGSLSYITGTLWWGSLKCLKPIPPKTDVWWDWVLLLSAAITASLCGWKIERKASSEAIHYDLTGYYLLFNVLVT